VRKEIRAAFEILGTDLCLHLRRVDDQEYDVAAASIDEVSGRLDLIGVGAVDDTLFVERLPECRVSSVECRWGAP
jgi:hypothetical protein